MPCWAHVAAQQSECWGTQTPAGSAPQKPPQVMSDGQVPQSRVPQQPSDAGPHAARISKKSDGAARGAPLPPAPLAGGGEQPHTRGMPSSHGRQKQLAKQKKKREQARQKVARVPSRDAVGQEALVREAVAYPQGPAFISGDWADEDAAMPPLVTVIVTRVVPGGLVVPSIVLVDRTCLGVKNAFVARPMARSELAGFVAKIGEAFPRGMVPCELLVAQSVVYHALDYARALGFEPHPDFPEPLVGPRPEKLLDTPLAGRDRPFYVSGPDDDARRIVAHLEARLGKGGFDAVLGVGG